MPRKKRKPASEMRDDELLRRVFPEKVAREIEHEVEDDDSDSNSPNKDQSKG